jgi:hypothetical protein
MVKHISSHGFSVLMCSILASVLIEFLKPYYPDLLSQLEKYSRKLIGVFGIPLNVEYFSIVLIACLLAMIWGAIFKIRYN